MQRVRARIGLLLKQHCGGSAAHKAVRLWVEDSGVKDSVNLEEAGLFVELVLHPL
jgi:hypothetical protein